MIVYECPSKYTLPMTKVFDKYWFRENQKTLLYLLNSPLGGLVRRGMWIEDKERVVRITPESVHVLLPGGQIKATIYSNKQYAEALHKNYKPIWEAFHWWDMTLANRFAPQLNLGFDTYTSQPDDTTGYDTYAENDSPYDTQNFDGSNLFIGEVNIGAAVARAFIKFDMSSISSSASITSGTCTLKVAADYSSNARTFEMHRILRNWVETELTWVRWSVGNNWTTGGCGGAGTDYDSSVVHASTSFSATESVGTAKDFTLNTTELKKMIDGTYTNYGWRFAAQTESNDGYEFYDSSDGTSTNRPKMVIVYTVVAAAGQVIWFS